MNLTCDQSIAATYKSKSQQARVISEGWFGSNVYCLACNSDKLEKAKTNAAAWDFFCPYCGHNYEVKSINGELRKSLPDGAYKTMLERINSSTSPTLCMLNRTMNWEVVALTAVHSSFLVPFVIEKRNPLSKEAERADHVMCNIRLDRISSDALIPVIKNRVVVPKRQVREDFQRFLRLSRKKVENRGWTILTLSIVRKLNQAAFSLNDLCQYEREFAEVYPDNHHIRAKIRQQLQVLRDMGILAFVRRGEYKMLD